MAPQVHLFCFVLAERPGIAFNIVENKHGYPPPKINFIPDINWTTQPAFASKRDSG